MTSLAPCPPGVDEDVWAGLCARVQSEAGWHIAPSKTETLRVAVRGADRIVVPTLMLTSVTSATTVATSDTPATALTIDRFTAWGTIYVSTPDTWPWYDLSADVDFVITHGYATCPEDLLLALQRAAQSAAPAGVPGGRLQAGPFSAEYADDLPTPLVRAIEAHALPDPA